MTHPSLPIVSQAIETRYADLAGSCCSLSCGEAFTHAAPTVGETFVDLGCGRGQDVIRAAGRVGPTGMAIGVDRTIAMIEKAQASVPPFLKNIRFLCCDLASLDLPDASTDVVISNCTINHAIDKQAVYQEIFRILRPSGRFVVSDVIADSELPETVRNDPAAWAACYGGAIQEKPYLDAIIGAGLKQIEVIQKSDPYEKGGVMVRSLTVRGFR